jgi:hypothetical protein
LLCLGINFSSAFSINFFMSHIVTLHFFLHLFS